MRFRILKLILWPVREGFKPRIVSFEEPGVQVISGSSKTGKSALIPIIDYCLAADSCAIPVGPIRTACSWFGILIETDQSQMLLARREPGILKSTGDMHFAEGPKVEIPAAAPEKNSNAEIVKSRLDELAGLSRLDFDAYRTGSGFRGRPSFRDMMAFTFQPQNIVANPDVLFFKADTYDHREKLKTIFPYVLGAITPDILAAQHELESVRKTLARKERELKNIQHVSERWYAELQSWASQAREYGLIAHPIEREASRDDLYAQLKDVLDSRRVPVLEPERITESARELVDLQDEESRVDTQLRLARRRLNEMTKLKENSSRYGDALRIQRERLAVAKWLITLEDETHSCPVCDSPIDARSPQLVELNQSLEEIERQSSRAADIPASFDREMTRVREEISLAVEKLKGISLRKSEVESRSAEARNSGLRAAEVWRFIGRLESGLAVHESLGQDGELSAEVAELKERESELSKIVSQAGTKKRLETALDKMAMFAQRHIPKLDAERPNDPISLSVTDLTIKVKGESRDDYLWEVGSGANWLSYHIAISLALQELFLSQKHSPVPSFLVYDQPSQVYFPRRLAHKRDEAEGDDPKLERDEDVIAVRKVFSVLAETVAEFKGRLQVVVLDHAAADVWGEVTGIHLVEEWRGRNKLIPLEWLE